jgi:hypothetical protein
LTNVELEEMGLKVTKNALATARKHGREVGYGEDPPKPFVPPSKAPVSSQTKEKVENFLNREDITAPSSSRVVDGIDVCSFFFIFLIIGSKYVNVIPGHL